MAPLYIFSWFYCRSDYINYVSTNRINITNIKLRQSIDNKRWYPVWCAYVTTDYYTKAETRTTQNSRKSTQFIMVWVKTAWLNKSIVSWTAYIQTPGLIVFLFRSHSRLGPIAPKKDPLDNWSQIHFLSAKVQCQIKEDRWTDKNQFSIVMQQFLWYINMPLFWMTTIFNLEALISEVSTKKTYAAVRWIIESNSSWLCNGCVHGVL